MAVQILNDMPDAAVYRGESGNKFSFERGPSRRKARLSGRSVFMGATIALHVFAIGAFMSIRYQAHAKNVPDPIMATMMDAPAAADEKPPEYVPPENVVYALPVPQELSFESDAIAPEVPPTTVISQSAPQAVAPPLVEAVEYVRAPRPQYPQESNRKRERGTVLLRVLVDATGRPTQIQVERSSGHSRLDSAAREAVEKAVFRPYEVNGIAQPAQVLIPIEFTRRAS